MPYNNTPIAPTDQPTGTLSLPLARIKKIIATDTDIASCSNNAAFVITAATELFLQHLVEQSYNIVKSERKPRRNIQYRDVANAVARVENLEFLGDVVPKTVKMGTVREKVGKSAGGVVGDVGKGQRTLDGKVIGEDAEDDEDGGVEVDGQAVNGARDGEDKMDLDGEADDDVSMHTANEEQPAVPVGKLLSP